MYTEKIFQFKNDAGLQQFVSMLQWNKKLTLSNWINIK